MQMIKFPWTNIHRSGGRGSLVWWFETEETCPQVLDIVGTAALLMVAVSCAAAVSRLLWEEVWHVEVPAEFLTKFPKPFIKLDAEGNVKLEARRSRVMFPLDALRFLECSPEFILVFWALSGVSSSERAIRSSCLWVVPENNRFFRRLVLCRRFSMLPPPLVPRCLESLCLFSDDERDGERNSDLGRVIGRNVLSSE